MRGRGARGERWKDADVRRGRRGVRTGCEGAGINRKGCEAGRGVWEAAARGEGGRREKNGHIAQEICGDADRCKGCGQVQGVRTGARGADGCKGCGRVRMGCAGRGMEGRGGNKTQGDTCERMFVYGRIQSNQCRRRRTGGSCYFYKEEWDDGQRGGPQGRGIGRADAHPAPGGDGKRHRDHARARAHPVRRRKGALHRAHGHARGGDSAEDQRRQPGRRSAGQAVRAMGRSAGDARRGGLHRGRCARGRRGGPAAGRQSSS